MAKNLLQTKTSPLNYKRIPWEDLNVKKQKTPKQVIPAGSEIGSRIFKKGGKVRSTGPALVHKGERVLNVKQTQAYDSAKKKKMSKALSRNYS